MEGGIVADRGLQVLGAPIYPHSLTLCAGSVFRDLFCLGVCYLLSVYYPATCGPNGHRSNSAAAKATVAGFTYPFFPGHRPTEPVIVGPPSLLPPSLACVCNEYIYHAARRSYWAVWGEGDQGAPLWRIFWPGEGKGW